MLVWLTLPFYDFCGFRSVAVNSVYKLQFFYIYRIYNSMVDSTVQLRCPVMNISSAFYQPNNYLLHICAVVNNMELMCGAGCTNCVVVVFTISTAILRSGASQTG